MSLLGRPGHGAAPLDDGGRAAGLQGRARAPGLGGRGGGGRGPRRGGAEVSRFPSAPEIALGVGF